MTSQSCTIPTNSHCLICTKTTRVWPKGSKGRPYWTRNLGSSRTFWPEITTSWCVSDEVVGRELRTEHTDTRLFRVVVNCLCNLQNRPKPLKQWPLSCCQGYLCLPYMALQQHHLLSDVAVRGFVAGATNILFRQQRHLSDAIIDVSPARTKASVTCDISQQALGSTWGSFFFFF